jgi:hypothetical protein
MPEKARNDLRLFQVEHEPVAVVVVTRVMVIKLRRFAAFERRPERLAIPVGDDVDTVRIG